MKLKYLDKVPMRSNGILFTEGLEVELDDKVGEVLLETFPNKFKELEVKPAPKAKTTRAKVKEPKAD